MNSQSIKNSLLVLFFVFTSQLIYAQQANAIDDNRKKTDNYNSHSSMQHAAISNDEVLKMFPEAVKYEKKFYPAGKNNYKIRTVKVIDQEKLNAAMASSIKEQEAEIRQLRSEISSMKTK